VLDHADQLSPRTRARALAGAGLVSWDRGDVAEARTLSIASADLLDDEQLGSLRAYVLAGTAVTAIDDPELRDWAVRSHRRRTARGSRRVLRPSRVAVRRRPPRRV